MKKHWWLLVFVGLFLLTACQGESTERLWLKSPDWSRAQVVGGMGIPDPAPIAIDGTGNSYFLFINGELEALQAQVTSRNSEADSLWEHTFPDILKLPDDPQLVWDGTNLHTFWVSNGALFSARLDSSGNVLQEPAVISGDVRVDSYSAVGDSSGRLAVWFSSDRQRPGLYMADTSLDEPPLLVDPEGIFPALRFDDKGTLHAIWAHYPRGESRTAFLYGAYQDGQYSPEIQQIIYETNIPQTASMFGPTLGLDVANIYIYWVQIIRTGTSAGTTVTRYIYFPAGDPDQISASLQVVIPAEHDLPYEPYSTGTLQVGERYSLQSRPSPAVTILQDIYTNPSTSSELAVTFRSGINYYWRRSASQIGLVYMQNGLPTSYQLLSFTQQASTDPTVISDDEGRLYVTWLETGDTSRFDVYFASTRPEIQKTFNPVTRDDVTQLSAATIFGLLTGILLAPLAAMIWLVVPIVTIPITSIFRRGDQTLRSPGTIISLIIALVLFQTIKIASLPAITDYVPFSAWLPLPDIMKVPLQIIVPILIMVGALVISWNFTYRRKSNSPFFFMLLYIATDALFTMAIYGVLFYGAF
jgi:hypothetical protein